MENFAYIDKIRLNMTSSAVSQQQPAKYLFQFRITVKLFVKNSLKN
jgi:hypothetical protein